MVADMPWHIFHCAEQDISVISEFRKTFKTASCSAQRLPWQCQCTWLGSLVSKMWLKKLASKNELGNLWDAAMSVLLHICWGGTSHPCAKNQKAFSHLHMPQHKRTSSKKSMAKLTSVFIERHQWINMNRKLCYSTPAAASASSMHCLRMCVE